MTIYVLYLRRLSGAPAHEPHLVGPSAYVTTQEGGRIVNYTMFVVAAAVILLCAEPFAESIIELGEAIGVSEFLLVNGSPLPPPRRPNCWLPRSSHGDWLAAPGWAPLSRPR